MKIFDNGIYREMTAEETAAFEAQPPSRSGSIGSTLPTMRQ